MISPLSLGKRVASLFIVLTTLSCSDHPLVEGERFVEAVPSFVEIVEAAEGERFFVVTESNDRGAAVESLLSQMAPITSARRLHSSPHVVLVTARTDALQSVEEIPGVVTLLPDYLVSPSQVQPAPGWALDRIDQRQLPLDNLFRHPFSGIGTNIYVIDTGIDSAHPEFSGRMGNFSGTYVSPFDPWIDCHGHGTKIAGAAAGTTFGVAKAAIFNPFQVGRCSDGAAWAGDISLAFEFIATYGAKPGVINLSYGGTASFWNHFWEPVSSAINYANNAGFTVVVAAGNDGIDACDSKWAYKSNVIAVGAVDQQGSLAVWNPQQSSNYGPCVNLYAPGKDTNTATTGGGSGAVGQGTSIATPYVTGTVAALLSYAYPIAPLTVRQIIGGSSTKGVVLNPGPGGHSALLFSLHNWARIEGPGNIIHEGNHTWTANAVGGDGNYSYEWDISFDGVNYTSLGITSSSYTRYISAGDPNFFLALTVASLGESVITHREINVLIDCDDRLC